MFLINHNILAKKIINPERIAKCEFLRYRNLIELRQRRKPLVVNSKQAASTLNI